MWWWVMLCAPLAMPGYSSARSEAEPLSNLGRFLEAYVGDCESDQPGFDRAGCMAQAESTQRKYRGRLLVLEIADVDEVRERLTFAGWDERHQGFRLHLVPFFSSRALGLSVGAPARLTRDGAPVVKNIPIWVKRPAGQPDYAIRRMLERGMVRLELLVRPKGVWRLKRSGHEAVTGVEVALVGVRVYADRGQDILAEQLF